VDMEALMLLCVIDAKENHDFHNNQYPWGIYAS